MVVSKFFDKAHWFPITFTHPQLHSQHPFLNNISKPNPSNIQLIIASPKSEKIKKANGSFKSRSLLYNLEKDLGIENQKLSFGEYYSNI